MALHNPTRSPLALKWDTDGAEIGLRRELSTLLRQLDSFRLRVCKNPPRFFTLPEEEIQPILNASALLKRFKHLVVIGVGGSSLGAEALVLLHGDHKRCVTFLNNLDPFDCRKLLKDRNPEETGYVVVSKSGTTPEVLAQFSVVLQHTKQQLGKNWLEHWVAITNQDSGVLREFINKESIRSLIFPSDLSGRYSVLSPSGLLPALWGGVDIFKLREGAQGVIDAWVDGDQVAQNIMKISALYYLHHMKFNRTISVMMPYGSRFRKFAEWYSQLWAESLGKPLGNKRFAGSTPLVAIGTTDQHSLLQLFAEGGDDKIYTLVTLDDYGEHQAIPTLFSGKGSDYLKGHSLEDLTKIEASSTIKTLRNLGRPVIHIEIPKIDERFTGELLMSYQLITISVASLYNVNPFDQPGVEANKRLTIKMLSGLQS